MTGLARQVREQVQRALQQVRQAFRAVAAGNTQGKLQGVQMEGLAGEAVDGELFQHYGFTSAPLAGAEYIVIPVGGSTNHAVVVASEDGRYRLAVQGGEVALYTDEGDYVHMKRGRVIEVETDTLRIKATTKVIFDTPVIETTGDIKGAGEIADRVRSMQADRDIYNVHGHNQGPPPDKQQ
ncbi:phage baseplate assembly protein V [Pseudomonas asplenii]|uniref:phage baseplate assembly protein V n=1 Tax=Pseudomonas asplenii TaxID=53407 RepID=UPI0006B5B5AA|nr:phage baseplate assembly protein V [Pseudomonas fuscovaginae]